MECSGIKELIVRYSSGDIEAHEKDIVQGHISDCGECERTHASINSSTSASISRCASPASLPSRSSASTTWGL